MPPHSSTLAWKIPWTEEPLGLQSVGSQRVGHNWSNLAAAAAACLVIIAFASPNGTVKREHIIHTTHVYFHTEETEFILHQGEDYDSLDWSIWGKKIKIKYALLIFPLGARCLHIAQILLSTSNPKSSQVRESESEVTQSCPTLCDPMDCSLPHSSIHGIFQARVLEWAAMRASLMAQL